MKLSIDKTNAITFSRKTNILMYEYKLFHSTNYFSQLLNVHRVSDVKQIEIHTAEPLVPESSPFEVDIAIAKFKKYNSLGSDLIPAELFQAGSE
jgi:hypothetical protein